MVLNQGLLPRRVNPEDQMNTGDYSLRRSIYLSMVFVNIPRDQHRQRNFFLSENVNRIRLME